MLKLPFVTWIANAAAAFTGAYGDVTRQAELADCSRQTIYDHAQKVQAAVVDAHDGGPTRAELLAQNQQLRQENAQLWDWLAGTIDFPEAKRREFLITAAAMGLSLNQSHDLLALVVGTPACPSRSAIHRLVQAAGHKAGVVLQELDRRCKALILLGCLDEIFCHGHPVLVGVEPQSLVWFVGVRSPDCTGETWRDTLRPWSALEYLVSDAGSGLQRGMALFQEERRAHGQDVPGNGLDVFHTVKEAQQARDQQWRQVQRRWEAAEAADAKTRKAGRQGRSRQGLATQAELAWRRVRVAMEAYDRAEAGWTQAHQALAVCRPDGRLNDPAWAREQITRAFPLLSDPCWSKVRGFLESAASLTFLERMHRQLQAAEPDDTLRGELVRLWWRRRQRPRAGATEVSGSGHVAHLVQQVVCQKQSEAWVGSYLRVSRVLRETVRASSVVECLNSVLRMHQSRHRTLTQELLDLKRLYWNCHRFRVGKRRDRSPYEWLGVRLPGPDFWSVLGSDQVLASRPETATTPGVAA